MERLTAREAVSGVSCGGGGEVNRRDVDLVGFGKKKGQKERFVCVDVPLLELSMVP